LSDNDRGRIAPSYWVIGTLLLVYVAVCAPQRDNVLGADAWEHHRTVLTLERHLGQSESGTFLHPGNPTFASDIPSVRYSPYTIFWAVVCRVTHITPYTALSIAAVINTALMLVGLWLLLDSFGEAAAATSVLIVMVSLWEGPPGWANSYALADLPWLQVNPSAIAFAFVLISWALFRRISTGRSGAIAWIGIVLLTTIAMLDHGMTAAFGIMGMFVMGAMGPGESRVKMLAGAFGVAVAVAVLCTPWPWFSFWGAVRWKGDQHYWFSVPFLRMELKEWIVPAVICSLLAAPFWRNALVRVSFVGGVLAMVVAASSVVTKSPTFARFPLPGLIYFHMMVGIMAHQWGIFDLRTWRDRVRGAFALPEQAYGPMLQIGLTVALACFLLPQVKMVVSKPWLFRPYIARALHRPDRQERLPRELPGLLKGVGENDVVLSDLMTSWLVPSTNGKIVSALHYELFVPDQRERWAEVTKFFSKDPSVDRTGIIGKYNVRWIVLNQNVPRIDGHEMDEGTAAENEAIFRMLNRPAAVADRVGDLVLIDAKKWVEAGATTQP
jgi:hypothetical protein